MSDWTPPDDAIVWIVCAACKRDEFIAAGPRHFDDVMRPQVEAYGKANGLGGREVWAGWDQGFIDQFGRFYSREEAMKIVMGNGQRFDAESNGGGGGVLFSEGLY